MRNIKLTSKEISELRGLFDVCSLDPNYGHDMIYDDRPDWLLCNNLDEDCKEIGLEITSSTPKEEEDFFNNIKAECVDDILSTKYVAHGKYILCYIKNGDMRPIGLSVPEYDVYYGYNVKNFYDLDLEIQNRIRSAQIIDPFCVDPDPRYDSFDNSMERFKIKVNDLQEYKHKCKKYCLYIHGCKSGSFNGSYFWSLFEQMKKYQLGKKRMFSIVYLSFSGMLMKMDFDNNTITTTYRKQFYDYNSILDMIDGKRMKHSKYSDIIPSTPNRSVKTIDILPDACYEPHIPDTTQNKDTGSIKFVEKEIPPITVMMEECIKRRRSQTDEWL